MDGEGRPMSKSLGNVILAPGIIKQYGADVLRLWVGSSDYAGDVRLSPEILKGLTETTARSGILSVICGEFVGFQSEDSIGGL